MEYLYAEDLPGNAVERHAEALLGTADKYQVPRLGAICEEYLGQHLAVGNVVGRAILAYLHKAEALKGQCLQFMRAHLRELKATEDWQQVLRQPEIMDALMGCDG